MNDELPGTGESILSAWDCVYHLLDWIVEQFLNSTFAHLEFRGADLSLEDQLRAFWDEFPQHLISLLPQLSKIFTDLATDLVAVTLSFEGLLMYAVQKLVASTKISDRPLERNFGWCILVKDRGKDRISPFCQLLSNLAVVIMDEQPDRTDVILQLL